MNHIKVSIIIPVYNTERYLCESVDSVLRQTHRNLEIILVNDGSTDNSPSICDECAKKDERVKVVHKQNSGASDARNMGFGIATGEYTYFMDSDDYIVDTAIEECLTVAENEDVDFVFFDSETICEDDTDAFLQKYRHLKRKGKYEADKGYKVLSSLVSRGEYCASVWLIFIRTSFIRRQGFQFYSGIILEDELYTFVLHLYANKVAHVNKQLYVYRIRRNSIITSTVSAKNFTGRYGVFCELLKLYKSGELETQAQSVLRRKLIGMYASYLSNYAQLDSEERQKVHAEKKKLRETMKSERYLSSIVARACSFPIVSRLATWVDGKVKGVRRRR